MLLRVHKISYAIHQLKVYGHMFFLKWSISLPCSMYLSDLDLLDKKIDEFETKLMSWIHYIWESRYHYPELNFYTTNQLILLRKELTNIHQNESDQINPQVFHLLHSIAKRPVESTMLIKKVLKGDVLEDEKKIQPNDVPSMPNSNQVIASSVNQKDEKAMSKVCHGIQELTSEQKSIFDELQQKFGYPDFIILQALLRQNYQDVYSAMCWIDDLTNDDLTNFESQWLETNINRIATVHNVESLTREGHLTNNTTKASGELNITHIASSFFDKSVTK